MKTLFVLLLALVAAAPSSFAQDSSTGRQTTRSVEGVVYTSSGKPQPDAIVQLKDTKSLQVRSFIALNDGSYHFHGLSGDIQYEVRAVYQGANSSTKNISIFDSRTKITQDLKLK